MRRGTNVGADMGGGWFSGRGDDTMTMFLGYRHMVDFFTGFEWWKPILWFSAVTGEQIDLPPVDGPSWTSPPPPDANEWAMLLQRNR